MPALDAATTFVQDAVHACLGVLRAPPHASTRRRRRHVGSVALTVAVLLAALLVAFAAPALGREVAGDPNLDARLNAIASELRCIACGNRTLAESDSALAVDLRAQMRAKLDAGADDDAVRAFITDRYGDVVQYRPPVRASTALLWFGPPVLLGFGMVALVVFLRRRRRTAHQATALDVDTEAGFAAQHPSLP
jgi:cytochrome c-type biogenesis protein CcmH